MRKKENKKRSRAITVAACICAVAVIALVGVLAFIDPIVGNVKLNKVRAAAKDCEEIVVFDPLHDDSFYRGAEKILTDNEAEKFADSFLDATKKTSYKKVIDGSKGFWNIKIDFYTDDEKHAIYLREDSVYVAGDNGYLFEINGEDQQMYTEFYETVVSLLSEE